MKPIEISSLHETAMAFAEQALRSQDPRRAQKFFRSAFEHERKAAELLEDAYDFEPTRSVLYRSAATLARDCKEYGEAKRLIQKGLMGTPPTTLQRS
jgi:cell fate regulator YaaT (PSP1 superfamily)